MINDGRRFLGLLLAVVMFATGQGCGSAPMDGELELADDGIMDDPGRLELAVAGLPTGTDADVTVTSPDGRERPLAAGDALERLQPGDYTVTSAAVLGSDGFGYRPDPVSQTVVVESGATTIANVTYEASSGSLLVAVNGLSPAAEADLTVTGPNGFRVDVSEQSTVLTDLEPGGYTVAMRDVTSDAADFIAEAPLSQSVFVNEGFAETINMSYSCARVYIGDPEVESALRQATGKAAGDFDCEDLAGVTDLYLSDEADNLVGLQHVRNLGSFRTAYRSDPENGIDDLEPLRHLTSLVELDLSQNDLSDLEPLAGLENLRALSIYGNATPLQDLTPLQGLEALTELALTDCGLTAEAIEPLRELTQLESLHVDNNPLHDVSALSTLINLKTLNIGACAITDVGPLAEMSQMETLFLSANQISDLGPLAGMAQLERLLLPGNPIIGLAALEGKSELEVLYLYNTDITDTSIRSLAGMTKLKILLMPGASISDIEPFGTLTSLEWLDLRGTAVSDLSPLGGLENLQQLDVAYTKVPSLDDVGELRSLTRLDASGNAIEDVSPLAGLSALASLRLNDNSIEDLSPLQGLGDLASLELDDNKVTDLTRLGGLSELRFLYLRNNFVTDLSPLVVGPAMDDGLLRIACNSLDMSPGSDALADIASLEADGVNVQNGAQRPDPSCN